MARIACSILVLALIVGTVRGEIQDGCTEGFCNTDVLLLQVSNEILATDEPSTASQVKDPELQKELQEKLREELPQVAPAPLLGTNHSNIFRPSSDAPLWWSSVEVGHHRPLVDHIIGSGDGFRLIFNFTGVLGHSFPEDRGGNLHVDVVYKIALGLLACMGIICFFWLTSFVADPTINHELAAETEVDGVKGVSRAQLLFLAQVQAIGMMSQDMYIPNMVDMAKTLGVSNTLESLTLEANWITAALTCVTVGLVSDRFGRRPLMIFCFVTYIIGSLGTATSASLLPAISFRVLQGIGEACMVLPIAIVRDLVSDAEHRGKINAVYSIVGTTGVVLAPTLGGVMGSVWGWRAVFLFLAMWGTCLLAFTVLYLPESNPLLVEPSVQSEAEEGGVSRERKNIEEFTKLFKRGGCPLCALVWVQVFFAATIMSMLCALPFVIEDGRGLSTAWCSLFMVAFALFVMVGVAVNVRLKNQFEWGNDSLIAAGLNIFVFSGLSFMAVYVSSSTTLLPLIFILIPPCLLTLSGGIMNGPLNAKYMEHFGPVAGTAAGVLSTLNSIITAGYAYGTTWKTETSGEIGWSGCLATGILSGAAGYAAFRAIGGGLPPKNNNEKTDNPHVIKGK